MMLVPPWLSMKASSNDLGNFQNFVDFSSGNFLGAEWNFWKFYQKCFFSPHPVAWKGFNSVPFSFVKEKGLSGEEKKSNLAPRGGRREEETRYLSGRLEAGGHVFNLPDWKATKNIRNTGPEIVEAWLEIRISLDTRPLLSRISDVPWDPFEDDSPFPSLSRRWNPRSRRWFSPSPSSVMYLTLKEGKGFFAPENS